MNQGVQLHTGSLATFICLNGLFYTRFCSFAEKTLQEQHLHDDNPHQPGCGQWLCRHDHLQTKVHGADLWPGGIQS